MKFILSVINNSVKCDICGEIINAKSDILISSENLRFIIICEKCAYEIHCAYEANM